MQREIAYFLASGKNYFYTISYLLMNQAHISKGVRVESFNASLQGVLEICRTNLSPCVRKPLRISQANLFRFSLGKKESALWDKYFNDIEYEK